VSSGATSVPRTTRRRPAAGLPGRRAVLATAVVVLLAVAVAVLYAGSETRLADGTTVAGVDVGGLERTAATALLLERGNAVEHTPVTFVAAGKEFQFTASQLGVKPHWAAAVAAAVRAADGLGPVRGVRRLRTRLLGVDIEPATSAYPSAVRVAVARIAHAVDRPAVDARLRRRGRTAVVVPERAGATLDRSAASVAVVAALASLDRGTPVTLPIVRAEPKATAADLADAQRAFRVATSAPVTTLTTPGSASAFDVSIPTMRACACGLRTIAAWAIPGRAMSSM